MFGYPLPAIAIGALLLFLGAMGKSAQIGLHTWLPDAMEGPTPVSALIHAATLVTAGIFLIIRCSALFEAVPEVLLIIALVGAITAFFAATAGLVQNDLKKVIAYSTCSQLGYMAFTCGVSHYALSLFHLANHAFFKALLFLGAGIIIHSISNEQDMRRYGGLLKLMPFVYTVLLVASLALGGFPFLTGFYSKDLILETVAGLTTNVGLYVRWLSLITAFFTAFYSARLLYMTFFCSNRSNRITIITLHRTPVFLIITLLILAIASVVLGYVGRDMFVGFGTDV
jgi:NADH:ubiquinone oxidoreductase subunit 5 (subunit L)/multisubunit Na+/H+ antiporter MnhA subunit